ncbi:MAG: hypothetical protein V8Q29_04385 [Alistipes shahii]
MVRALPVLLLLLSAACGLAEDERDEKNRYIYLTFYDKAFEAYCLGEFDVDGDGRISRYEAQRVRTVECPERGVASLSDLKEFTRLERLDCRGNALTRLDVTMTRLEWLDCSDNGLVSLDVNGLRGLAYLDCGGNSLPRLDLQSNASLATLLCPDNALAGSLDVTSCASGLRADVRGNPSLATVYCLASQSVDFNGPTERPSLLLARRLSAAVSGRVNVRAPGCISRHFCKRFLYCNSRLLSRSLPRAQRLKSAAASSARPRCRPSRDRNRLRCRRGVADDGFPAYYGPTLGFAAVGPEIFGHVLVIGHLESRFCLK